MDNSASGSALDTPSRRHARDCPVEDWLAFLGHRWNALILWQLQAAPLRHGALAEQLAGIAPKVLQERLTGLEQRGLLQRNTLAGFPRGVSYTLTERGRSLLRILDQLERWDKATPMPGPPSWPTRK